jgi:hypothetical protein
MQKMEGFYTKEEAANILGVSVRQVNNYLKAGRLTRVKRGSNRTWIPKRDVQLMYEDDERSVPPSPADIHALIDRVTDLEKQIEVLKMGIGFGTKTRLRTDAELLVIRQSFIDDLSKRRWSKRRIAEVGDELQKIREEEVGTLYRIVGPMAWVPLCDLATRMVAYVEQHADYPAQGLDVLLTRVLRARDRFYGMVYASTKIETGLPRPAAVRVHKAMVVTPDAIEVHIMHYIDGIG